MCRPLEKPDRPVVAAIGGSALGGGIELVLACHHRIVLRRDGLLLGLPEINFGILPGAGGVVRLTALIGLYKALDYLLSGKTVDAETALCLETEALIELMVRPGTVELIASFFQNRQTVRKGAV